MFEGVDWALILSLAVKLPLELSKVKTPQRFPARFGTLVLTQNYTNKVFSMILQRINLQEKFDS